MYLYQMVLYKNHDRVIGLPAGNDTNLADFEANHKATTVKVDGIVVSETTFVIEKTYTTFGALIVSPLTWADVKYVETDLTYELLLLTE